MQGEFCFLPIALLFICSESNNGTQFQGGKLIKNAFFILGSKKWIEKKFFRDILYIIKNFFIAKIDVTLHEIQNLKKGYRNSESCMGLV